MAQLGGYTLVRELGRGGFATVWLATDGTPLPHAIKAFSTEHGPELDRQKARNERACLERFQHPNLIALREVLVDQRGVEALVLEYCEGGDLITRMKRRTEGSAEDERDAYLLWRQILEGCKHMHSRGVSHLDLKPQNVLLATDEPDNPAPTVKLCDFSHSYVATAEEPLVPPTQVGAGKYMAPEVSSGLPYDGYKADVWSCGAILYTLLCGSLPFADAEKIVTGQWNEMAWFSPALTDLFNTVFVVSPKDRISMDELSVSQWCADCAAAADVPLPGATADVSAGEHTGHQAAATDAEAVAPALTVEPDALPGQASVAAAEPPGKEHEDAGAAHFDDGDMTSETPAASAQANDDEIESSQPQVSALSVVLEDDAEIGSQSSTRPTPTHGIGNGAGAPPEPSPRGAAAAASDSGGGDVYGVPSSEPRSLPPPVDASTDATFAVTAVAETSGAVQAETKNEPLAQAGQSHSLNELPNFTTPDTSAAIPAEPMPHQTGKEKPERPGRSRHGSNPKQPSPARLSKGSTEVADGTRASEAQRLHVIATSSSPPRRERRAQQQHTPPSLDAQFSPKHNGPSRHPSYIEAGRRRSSASLQRGADGSAEAPATSSYMAIHGGQQRRSLQAPPPLHDSWTGDRADAINLDVDHVGSGYTGPYGPPGGKDDRPHFEPSRPLSPPSTPPSLAALEARQRQLNGPPALVSDRQVREAVAGDCGERPHVQWAHLPVGGSTAAQYGASSDTPTRSSFDLPAASRAVDFRHGFVQLNELLEGSPWAEQRRSMHKGNGVQSMPNLVDWEDDSDYRPRPAAGGASGDDHHLAAVVGLAMNAVERLGGVGYDIPTLAPIAQPSNAEGMDDRTFVASKPGGRAVVPPASHVMSTPDAPSPSKVAHASEGAAKRKATRFADESPRVARCGSSSASEAAASSAGRTSQPAAAVSPDDKPGAKGPTALHGPLASKLRARYSRSPAAPKEARAPKNDSDKAVTHLPPAVKPHAARVEDRTKAGGMTAARSKQSAQASPPLPKVPQADGAPPATLASAKTRHSRPGVGGKYAAGGQDGNEDASPATRPNRLPLPRPAKRSSAAAAEDAPIEGPGGGANESVRSASSERKMGDGKPAGNQPSQLSGVARERAHANHAPRGNGGGPAIHAPHSVINSSLGYGMPTGLPSMPVMRMPPFGMPPPGMLPPGFMPPPMSMLPPGNIPPMASMPPQILQAMMMSHGMPPWRAPIFQPPMVAPPVQQTKKKKNEPVIRLLPAAGGAPAPSSSAASRPSMPMPPIGPPPPFMGVPIFAAPFNYPGQLGYLHTPSGYPA